MSSIGIVGEVVETGRCLGAFSFEWRIPNFPSLKDGCHCSSPHFFPYDGRWNFKLYPFGLPGITESLWVNLFLIRHDAGPPKTFNLKIGIRGPEGIGNEKERIQEFSEDDNMCFWSKFCPRYELMSHEAAMGSKSRLMPGDMLIISIDMKIYMSSVARGGIQRAMEDFGSLLVSGENSDVAVQVAEREFKVHSVVLLARSPALSLSLRHESAERASNKIVVEDCEPRAFGEFLQFVYTGSVPSITDAFALHRIADRYLADDLKDLCLEHIRNALSVETFCETVMLAVTHGEGDLLGRASAFGRKNARSITRSKEWVNFRRECPAEANEVLKKIPCLSS